MLNSSRTTMCTCHNTKHFLKIECKCRASLTNFPKFVVQT
uniref:Uncharacterized protein n=1 Tax=Anguilla anguilla TaxID=7936 RepID=A0A0E9UXU9_ANGAN